MKTYFKSTAFICGFLFILNLCACATTIDVYSAPKADQLKIKSIYLVKSSQEMDDRIKNNLMSRKIQVVTGPETKQVLSQDAILKYTEVWTQDVTTYLQTLDFVLFDKSGELVTSTPWKHSKFSTLTTVNSVLNDSLDSLFEKIQINEK